jgi:hypothetical protein
MRKRRERVAAGNFLLTIKEAAEELRLTPEKLKALIVAGRGPEAIAGSSVGFVRISRQAMDAYKATRAA